MQLFAPECLGSSQKWGQVCQCIRHACCVSEQFVEAVCHFGGVIPELLDHGFYSTCPGDLSPPTLQASFPRQRHCQCTSQLRPQKYVGQNIF